MRPDVGYSLADPSFLSLDREDFIRYPPAPSDLWSCERTDAEFGVCSPCVHHFRTFLKEALLVVGSMNWSIWKIMPKYITQLATLANHGHENL